MTALILAVLALLLAWPVPVLLGRARWVRRAPATAMVLWQAVALAGGLAMIGTPLAWGLAPYGSSLQTAVPGAAQALHSGDWFHRLGTDDLAPARIAAVTLALVLTAHLLLTLGVTGVRTLTERRRHRQLVDLLAAPGRPPRLDGLIGGSPTRVLPHQTPVAYCLPGLTGAVTVVSHGLLEQLTADEVRAVVAHERAHVRQRHDLLRLAFEAWHRAFPWLPTTQVARRAVSGLTEMLADDSALREHRREVLVSALARTGTEPPPTTDTDAAASSAASVPITLRLYRLLSPVDPLPAWQRFGVVLAAGTLALLPPIVLLSP